MATFESFEDIEAWKEARKLVQSIRKLCRESHVSKDFAFVDQITRSARSIAANIAEGFESSSIPEFVRFLGFAKRSAGETRAHLYDALDEKYVTQELFTLYADQTIRIGKMLASLMAYLRSSRVDQTKRRVKSNTSSPQTTKPSNPLN